MGLFTMLRFLTPNGTVTVSEAANDLTTTAALGQAVENLDTYASRINGTNALTSAGTIDASLASDTTGLRVPNKAGAAPTVAGNIAFDSTAGGLVFGDGANTVGLTGTKRLGDTTLGIAATNITFSSIPGTYKHLRLVVQSRGDGAVVNENVCIQLNADATANYDSQELTASNTTVSAAVANASTQMFVCMQPGANAGATEFSAIAIDIPNYANTTAAKSLVGVGGFVSPTASQQNALMTVAGWRSAVAITSIKLFPQTSTNFVAGTRASLYAAY